MLSFSVLTKGTWWCYSCFNACLKRIFMLILFFGASVSWSAKMNKLDKIRGYIMASWMVVLCGQCRDLFVCIFETFFFFKVNSCASHENAPCRTSTSENVTDLRLQLLCSEIHHCLCTGAPGSQHTSTECGRDTKAYPFLGDMALHCWPIWLKNSQDALLNFPYSAQQLGLTLSLLTKSWDCCGQGDRN